MKSLPWRLALVSAALAPTLGFAQTASSPTPTTDTYVLTLRIEGVRSAQGQLRAELLGQRAGDTRPRTVSFGVRDARLGVTVIDFPALPAGDYAVQVYHDENANGKVDMNMLGLPLEGYGFSNTPLVRGGIPQFSKMKVSVATDVTTTAVLAYAP